MFRSITAAVFIAGSLVLSGTAQAEPRINTIEPIHLIPGQTTEVKLRGNEFKIGDAPTRIWTSFPSTWELIEDRENTNHELFFNVTVDKDSPVGPAAIRAWNHKGASKPALALIEPSLGIVFTTKTNEVFEHTFTAAKGKKLLCQVWSNRLNKESDFQITICDSKGNELETVDDHEVIGSDPYLIFDPPADGDYVLKIQEILWRDKVQACLQVTPYQIPDEQNNQTTPATLKLELKKGQYLTVTPRTLETDSPAQLLMDLHGPDGNRIERGGNGDSLLQPLRKKIEADGNYELHITDILRRKGLPFELDVSTEVAPFELTTNHLAWYVTEPGKEVKVHFRVIRHHYDGPITISSPDFDLKDVVIQEKKGNVNATIKIPDDADDWIPAQFFGTAEIEGQTYRAKVDTRDPLSKTPLNMIRWPEGVDGRIFFVIKTKEVKTS